MAKHVVNTVSEAIWISYIFKNGMKRIAIKTVQPFACGRTDITIFVLNNVVNSTLRKTLFDAYNLDKLRG